jgi:hypothetical protein
VLAIDCRSFGGQAGASARIENYLGFPTGISGMALMGRAYSQAQKFGVELAIPDEAVRLECGNDPCHVLLATGERIRARRQPQRRHPGCRSAARAAQEGSRHTVRPSPLEADLAPIRSGAGGGAIPPARHDTGPVNWWRWSPGGRPAGPNIGQTRSKPPNVEVIGAIFADGSQR